MSTALMVCESRNERRPLRKNLAIATLVIHIACGAMGGCVPAVPVPPSPPGSRPAARGSSTTAVPRQIVKKPQLPASGQLDPWEALADEKSRLDDDIDRWLANARRSTSPERVQHLTLLRRLHGTGGFLRQIRRECADRPEEFSPPLVASLDELYRRWERFEKRLADMNRALSFAGRTDGYAE